MKLFPLLNNNHFGGLVIIIVVVVVVCVFLLLLLVLFDFVLLTKIKTHKLLLAHLLLVSFYQRDEWQLFTRQMKLNR